MHGDRARAPGRIRASARAAAPASRLRRCRRPRGARRDARDALDQEGVEGIRARPGDPLHGSHDPGRRRHAGEGRGTLIDEFARYPDERIVEIERATSMERSAAFDACDVYAMPSLHETFGIGYLEAWLHEKPVIGGDIPPLRQGITNGVDGFAVPQGSDPIG